MKSRCSTPTACAAANPAPDFTLPDLDGKQVSLSSFRGKTVVLEWFNPGCPFVKYAYGKGPLRDLAKKKTSDQTAWLNINSGAPGKQGHGVETNRKAKQSWSIPSPILLDESGKVGQAYGARTTPHMYIVDPSGRLAYMGGIDDKPSISQRDIPAARNHVAAALDELLAGRPVSESNTRPYGCSIKYAD